jgi:hypothetical protein
MRELSLPSRLDFQLPDFVRTAWVSERARRVWEPRIQRISRALPEIERLTVLDGGRPAALQTMNPAEVVEHSTRLARHGVCVVPIQREGSSSAGYSSAAMPLTNGKPWNYRVVVTRNPDVAYSMSQAWGDDYRLGGLLSYPVCCRRFFHEIWGEGWRDTTLPMSAGETEVGGYSECNVLLRALGVRAVFHLPCSFDCEGSRSVAAYNLSVARSNGYLEEAEWLLAMLRWPVRWSALHGIAIITTPVFRLSVNTDALATESTVERLGEVYPEEGAHGNRFPFRPSDVVQISSTKSFERSVMMPSWEANGFSSDEAMRGAHVPLVHAASGLDPAGRTVMDLGCGDGTLVREICNKHGGVPMGVEIDPERHALACEEMPEGAVVLGDIVEQEFDEGAILLMSLVRLIECNDDERKRLLSKLHGHDLVVYLYKDADTDATPYALRFWCESLGLSTDFATVQQGSASVAATIRRSNL